MRSAALSPLVARAVGALGLAFLLGILAGCGSATGNVSGVVTYRGQPVTGGLITFLPADGSHNSVAVGIDGQGRYFVDLPAGEVTVAIDTRGLAGDSDSGGNEGALVSGPPPGVPLSPDIRAKLGGGGAAPKGGGRPKPKEAPAAAGKYVPIPEKYYMAETSGLKFKVKGGEQTQDFELTD
jgi:hypothetical protein